MKLAKAAIKNFRSLAIDTPDLLPVTIFYGANNSGKSNILLALDCIFSSKVEPSSLASAPGGPDPRPSPFYFGHIPDFEDNFRQGTDEPITFTIVLNATASDLHKKLTKVDLINPLLPSPGHDAKVNLIGKIIREGTSGRIQLDECRIDKNTVYRFTGTAEEFFPGAKFSSVPSAERQEDAESFLSGITDLFQIIGADRSLRPELLGEVGTDPTPETFHRWFLNLNLDRKRFPLFKAIESSFCSGPLGFTELGFSRDGDSLEIVVTDSNGLRLPLSKVGTGVQQVLYLTARILSSPSSIVGIEELELNLSVTTQRHALSVIQAALNDPISPVEQVLITSHSDYLGNRNDVRPLLAEMNASGQTTVRRFTSKDRATFFPRDPFRATSRPRSTAR